MNAVSSTAQIPTKAFADEVLLLILGAEFVPQYTRRLTSFYWAKP